MQSEAAGLLSSYFCAAMDRSSANKAAFKKKKKFYLYSSTCQHVLPSVDTFCAEVAPRIGQRQPYRLYLWYCFPLVWLMMSASVWETLAAGRNLWWHSWHESIYHVCTCIIGMNWSRTTPPPILSYSQPVCIWGSVISNHERVFPGCLFLRGTFKAQ